MAYDAVIVLSGLICIIGGVLAARKLSRNRVFYTGLVPPSKADTAGQPLDPAAGWDSLERIRLLDHLLSSQEFDLDLKVESRHRDLLFQEITKRIYQKLRDRVESPSRFINDPSVLTLTSVPSLVSLRRQLLQEISKSVAFQLEEIRRYRPAESKKQGLSDTFSQHSKVLEHHTRLFDSLEERIRQVEKRVIGAEPEHAQERKVMVTSSRSTKVVQ